MNSTTHYENANFLRELAESLPRIFPEGSTDKSALLQRLANEELARAALFEYLVENASLWDARNVTERLITATDRLADYPRLYETDERYGEGVRRISLLGQHVLYEVNDEASRVNILAVVGQRQNPRFIL